MKAPDNSAKVENLDRRIGAAAKIGICSDKSDKNVRFEFKCCSQMNRIRDFESILCASCRRSVDYPGGDLGNHQTAGFEKALVRARQGIIAMAGDRTICRAR